MMVSVVPSANWTDKFGLPSSDLSSRREKDGVASFLLLGKAKAMPKMAVKDSKLFILCQLVTDTSFEVYTRHFILFGVLEIQLQ